MYKKEKRRDEFDQKLLEIARVTRVTKGGKRMSFRAVIAIGNRKGKIGIGTGKGSDVSLAIEKSVRDAKKHLIFVPIVKDSILHEVEAKYIASKIFMKPAPQGSGLIAGGVIRSMAELIGIKNISAKSLRSSNKLNCARAVIIALQKLRVPKEKTAIAPKAAINKDIKKTVAEKPAVKTSGTVKKAIKK